MPCWGIVLYLVLMGCIFIFRLLPESKVEMVNDTIISIVCFLGSIQLFSVCRYLEPKDSIRRIWFLFGVGLFLESIGHGIYAWFELLSNEAISFPFYSDYFITTSMLLYSYSFSYFYYHLDQSDILPHSERKNIANLLFLVLFIVQGIFYIYPTMTEYSESLWMRILYLIYPVLDLVIAYFCLHLVIAFSVMGRSPIAKPWVILVIAYFVFLFTDSAYAYVELWGNYHPYLWINPGWGLAYLLVAHASYKQRKMMIRIDQLGNEQKELSAMQDASC